MRDGLTRELSQGRLLAKARRLCVRPVELKLRPVVALASCEARSRDWCDVVTAHAADSCAYVWRFENRALGPHELRQPHWPVSNMGQDQDPRHYATAVAISVCGNYALVGTAGGVTYKYNLQSGLPRGALPSGAHKDKPNHRKLEVGSVRLTAKRMKKALAGPGGHLRNAAGNFVRGKHGVGFAVADGGGMGGVAAASSSLEPTFGGGIPGVDGADSGIANGDGAMDGSSSSGGGGEGVGGGGGRGGALLERDDDVVDAVVVSTASSSVAVAEAAAVGAVTAAAEAEEELRWCRSAAAAHGEAVTGVAVDALNRTALTASLDGTLRWWNFQTGALDIVAAEGGPDAPSNGNGNGNGNGGGGGGGGASAAAALLGVARRGSAVIKVGSPVAVMELARDAGLVACGCDDAVVRIFDVESRRLVRRLRPSIIAAAPSLLQANSDAKGKGKAALASSKQKNKKNKKKAAASPLTDLAFSPDARRVYTTAQDGTLRVWDLPTSKCVDWVAFSRAAVRAHRTPKEATTTTAAAATATKRKTKKNAPKRQRTRSNEEEEEKSIDEEGEDDSDSDGDSDDDSDDDDDAVGLSPATNVCVSPNGEFICTSHAGEVGLHLWTDRTLYESVATLDREPRRPALLHAPPVLQETSSSSSKKKKGKKKKMGAGAFHGDDDDDDDDDEDGNFGSNGFDDDSNDDDDDDDDSSDSNEEDDKEERSAAAAAAAAKAAAAASDRGAISLSGLPRSHWETLFSLDLVRARNRPEAPPAAAPQAPFFLPTLRGNDGVAPSFGDGGSGSGGADGADGAVAAAGRSGGGGAMPLGSFDGAAALEAKKTAAEATKAKADEAEKEGNGGAAEVVMQSSGWGAAWSDDDDDDDDKLEDADMKAAKAMAAQDDDDDDDDDVDDDNDNDEKDGKAGGKKGRKKKGGKDDDDEDEEDERVVGYFSGGGSSSNNGTSSRLLRQTNPLAASRCRLAELLLQNDFDSDDDHDEDSDDEDEDEEDDDGGFEDEVMAFLKSLTPSAVDVELSGLAREGDVADASDEAVLVAALRWFAKALKKRTDFDVLQAYLQRFLRLHAEVIALAADRAKSNSSGGGGGGGDEEEEEEEEEVSSSSRRLGSAVRRAAAAQASTARKLRELVQQNLCLIQLFSNTQTF